MHTYIVWPAISNFLPPIAGQAVHNDKLCVASYRIQMVFIVSVLPAKFNFGDKCTFNVTFSYGDLTIGVIKNERCHHFKEQQTVQSCPYMRTHVCVMNITYV